MVTTEGAQLADKDHEAPVGVAPRIGGISFESQECRVRAAQQSPAPSGSCQQVKKSLRAQAKTAESLEWPPEEACTGSRCETRVAVFGSRAAQWADRHRTACDRQGDLGNTK